MKCCNDKPYFSKNVYDQITVVQVLFLISNIKF